MNNSLPDAPPLVVRDISKQYSTGIWANRNVTLTAERGEILGLLGPNGAGKTTLVRQITTELFPTAGEIRVFGHDAITEPDAAKRLMGIVPQEATLFGYLTVYHHLRIFGKLRGLSPERASQRADELVTELRLEEHRNVIADKLSGGLKRRVLIGIAILANPPLMVLDEPTTGLDPQARRDLWSLLRRYRENGATILLTTHYMEEAEALCDRVGIISHGYLLALDTVANLRASRGYEFKLTYSKDGSTAEPEVMYGADDGELVERVRSMGINQFTVSQTNLEDVFLALTGGEEGLDSDAG